MKIFGKKNNNGQHRRINRKVLIFASLAFVNVVAVSSVSLAWFITMTSETRMAAFSGDLDVDIEKITAYKYVYPFYGKSVDIVDYSSQPTLKGYVLEDKDEAIGEKGTAKITEIVFDSLGTGGSYVTSTASDVGPRKVHRTAELDFNYYIIGDDVFTGVPDNPWFTGTGAYLAADEDSTYSVRNVSISRGAKFSIFSKDNCGNGNSYNYFTYASVSGSSGDLPRFSIRKESDESSEYTVICCLTSGVYDITYSSEKITFTAVRSGPNLDDAAIGNNILDPTMINIDYNGSASRMIKPGTIDELLYPTINDYIPVAIQEQMTMVIFDVQLTYKNANPVVAGLEVRRGASTQISRATGGYATTSFTSGYTVSNNVVTRNPLDASDFFAYNALFAKESNAFQPVAASGDDPAKTAAEVLWETMHKPTDDGSFARFQVDPYDSVIACPLFPKTTSGSDQDSTLIQPSLNGNRYHCYIGVEYDCQHIPFFLNENRLGKRFVLDRDFGFFFSAKQALKHVISSENEATSVAVGSTLTLSSNAKNVSVTWESADESIATVSNLGVVTGVAIGSTTVTAKAEGYLDATFDVTVVAGS